MSSQQPGQPILSRGLSEHTWNILKSSWGLTATEVQKLPIVKRVQGPFERWQHPPDTITSRAFPFENNPKMHLEEIRYGSIQGVAVAKPSVWLIVRHEKEAQGGSVSFNQDNQKGQISKNSLFICWIMTRSANGNLQGVVSLMPVSVHSITEIGSNTYALLALHAEHFEMGMLESSCGGSLKSGEELVVQLKNSNQFGSHQSAVWKAR